MSTYHILQDLLWNLLQRSVAVLLLLPAFVIILFVGVLISFNSPGAMLIHQTRVGKGGISFSIYKLRTMVVNADAELVKCLAENDVLRVEWNQYGRLASDPRIAGMVASLARRFSIDELPQLLNVVFGQMNLVGPRPLPIGVAATMNPEHRECRNSVLPGMTGLWQISGRSELSIKDMGILDCKYVCERTVFYDLIILLRTVRAVLNGRGAY